MTIKRQRQIAYAVSLAVTVLVGFVLGAIGGVATFYLTEV